ncbi:YopX family protein [Lysinibacillus sp. FSL W8-0953]|uniref:YopX family protein n=1 Tax=Lysinibacillus sp. FSL W8-0953 TaxID=2954640 RepID=UPI0030F6FE76
MREIKFRAWDYNNECIIPWEKITLEKDEGENTFSVVVFDGAVGDHFDDFPYMQYTGLKDKNGKEIFEGDIVEYNDFNSLRTGGHAEDKIIVGKVTFGCGMWMVEEKNCGHDLYEGLVNDEELEVIGNIYENPEMLGDSQ